MRDLTRVPFAVHSDMAGAGFDLKGGTWTECTMFRYVACTGFRNVCDVRVLYILLAGCLSGTCNAQTGAPYYCSLLLHRLTMF